MSTLRFSGVIASGWLVGPLAATGTLVALAFASLGWFASLGGLVIAGILAFTVGTWAASVVDPRLSRNAVASIVVGYIVTLAAIYLLMLPSMAGPPPSGKSHGGPGVPPPLPLSK